MTQEEKGKLEEIKDTEQNKRLLEAYLEKSEETATLALKVAKYEKQLYFLNNQVKFLLKENQELKDKQKNMNPDVDVKTEEVAK